MYFVVELLYSAPELLRVQTTGTSRADIYSLGIILEEIIMRGGPYEAASATFTDKGLQ